MTCIITLKDGNRIYMGADSCVSGSHQRTLGEPKIIKKGEFLLGSAGSLRGAQLFQYATPLLNICEGEDPYNYLISTVCRTMRNVFSHYGFLYEENKQEHAGNNVFLMVFRGETYYIGIDFAIDRPKDSFTAIGSGQRYALGSLYATEFTDFSPEKRIKLALDAASKYDYGVAPPYEILSLEWDGFGDGDVYRFYDSDGTIKEGQLKNDKKGDNVDIPFEKVEGDKK